MLDSDPLKSIFRQLSAADYTREETYARTRADVDHAGTLIAEAYRCKTFYGIEQEQVFAKGWVCVGYTCQVSSPGDTFLVDVAEQPLVITKDQDSELRAFYNVCRHRGSRLLCKNGSYKNIRCPYHGWCWELNGELKSTPQFDKAETIDSKTFACAMVEPTKDFSKADYPLLHVNIDSWGCFIFVNLSKDCASLTQWLGDLPDRLTNYPLHELQLYARKDYTIEANWKLVAENFAEYYHNAWVHGELNKVSNFKAHHRFQGQGMYLGSSTRPIKIDPCPDENQLNQFPLLNENER